MLECCLFHVAVPRDFGNHTCSGDGKAERIPTDQGLMGEGKVRHRRSIDEDHVRRMKEPQGGAAHPSSGRLQDVDSVDLLHFHEDGTPHKALCCHELFVDLLPLLFIELLGVIQLLVTIALRQNHRGYGHWTRKRTASGFINAGNDLEALFLPGPLVAKAGKQRLGGGRHRLKDIPNDR